jgi:hypothetical protein
MKTGLGYNPAELPDYHAMAKNVGKPLSPEQQASWNRQKETMLADEDGTYHTLADFENMQSAPGFPKLELEPAELKGAEIIRFIDDGVKHPNTTRYFVHIYDRNGRMTGRRFDRKGNSYPDEKALRDIALKDGARNGLFN